MTTYTHTQEEVKEKKIKFDPFQEIKRKEKRKQNKKERKRVNESIKIKCVCVNAMSSTANPIRLTFIME